MKLTEWFPAEIEPVHVGVYQTRRYRGEEGEWFQLWNGQDWGLSSLNILLASGSEHDGAFQDVEWRGLAEKP